jgi:hypothetical protein
MYYTDKDVAQLLGVSLGRLRNKLTAGNPLPPRIQPPGCRKRLWECKAVHAWLERFTVTAAEHALPHAPRRRRGRHPQQAIPAERP